MCYYFLSSEGCLFTLLIVSLIVQRLLSLIRSHLFIFAFISCERWVTEDPSVIYVRECFAYVFLYEFFYVLVLNLDL